MRLYEVTDPTKYILPETDAADLLKRTDRDDDTADTVRCKEEVGEQD